MQAAWSRFVGQETKTDRRLLRSLVATTLIVGYVAGLKLF
jgi:hypothetical protein